jgi:hypothetical protein
MDPALAEEFAKVSSLSIDEQATTFLRSFVGEFSGKFNEVLDLKEEFKKYAPKEGETSRVVFIFDLSISLSVAL